MVGRCTVYIEGCAASLSTLSTHCPVCHAVLTVSGRVSPCSAEWSWATFSKCAIIIVLTSSACDVDGRTGGGGDTGGVIIAVTGRETSLYSLPSSLWVVCVARLIASAVMVLLISSLKPAPSRLIVGAVSGHLTHM